MVCCRELSTEKQKPNSIMYEGHLNRFFPSLSSRLDFICELQGLCLAFHTFIVLLFILKVERKLLNLQIVQSWL